MLHISENTDIELQKLSSEVDNLSDISNKISSSELNATEYDILTNKNNNRPIKAIEVQNKNEDEPIFLSNNQGKNKIQSQCFGDACNDALKKEKQENLDKKTREIAQKENTLTQKKSQLENLQNKLGAMDESITTQTETTSKTYDATKMRYLIDAKKLINKYAGIPFNKWPVGDQVKLGIATQNLGIKYGSNIIEQGQYLYSQLIAGNFAQLSEQYAAISTSSSSIDTTENLDYKNIQGQITALMLEIKKLNQELTVDKMQQSDLMISVNTLQDVTNTIKVTEGQTNEDTLTNSSRVPYLAGLYTENMYYENNMGEPVNSGFADGRAELTSPILDQGDSIKFYNPPPSSDLHHTEVLNQSPANYYGGYDYVAWGAWSDPNRAGFTQVYTSHWVLVDQIDNNQKPKTGTASYQGQLQGTLWTIGQDNSYHNADGTISMQANFGTNAINGNLQINNADTHTPFASAAFNTNMTTSSDGDGLNFQGQLTGPGISNQETWHSSIRGDFGGDQAAEVGGAWSITKGTGSNGNGQATGVFRAQKQ